MKKTYYYIGIIAAFLLIPACSNSSGGGLNHTTEPEPVAIDEAVDASEDIMHSTVSKYENEEFSFTWNFIPSSYFVAKEDLPDSLLTETQAAYAQKSSFRLEIKALKFHDELLKYKMTQVNDYYQRIEYYSFHFGKDIQLVADGDTIPCSEHHFERTYGISPTIKLSVNFNIPEQTLSSAKEISIVLFDRAYNQGIIKSSFDPATIKTLKVINH